MLRCFMLRRWRRGELEYKAKIIESNDNGFKDEFVLVLVSIPILLLGWSVFSDDPTIRDRIDLFFEYFKNLPYWYQAILDSCRGEQSMD